MPDAIILAGGVAKGAFGAGVLAGLADPAAGVRLDVRRIVAASSGALNGIYLGYATRNGNVRDAGSALSKIWLEEGNFFNAFQPSLRGLLALDGLSTSAKLRALMARHVPPSSGTHPVDLFLVVANLAGDAGRIGRRPATTFEHVLSFDGAAYDDAAGLARMFDAVTASAAFPIVFRPVPLPIGANGETVECVDGGAVNNTPVKIALADPQISRVFLISPYPDVMPPAPRTARGFSLLEHLADILVNERLYRDLRDAHEQNAALARLDALPRDARDAALEALGWTQRRRVPIIELRPPQALLGGSFAGIFSRKLRASYIDAGREVALAWARGHKG